MRSVAFAPDVRKVSYTTNALEHRPAHQRKIINTRAHFPSDAAAPKRIGRAMGNIAADGGVQPRR
ncbi:hypothetical protein [Pandoraea oxalativorans]|uniref:hypothetical protein n=1 Tax=Pandoraea oxalativorans TaxID=573737 RepID=UPI003CCBF28A